jgi:hypothetical protein
MMRIIPPELTPYDRERYIKDLEYRLMIDLETEGDRHKRLMFLFGKLSEL